MIWIILAVMAALALALLLPPLLLKPVAAHGAVRLDYDLAVYRDQLGEIERDVERGLLTADQAGAARTEIQRRMLAAGEMEGKGGKTAKADPAAHRRLAATIAVLVPAAAFGLYILLGAPQLPDRPYSSRGDEIAQARQMGGGQGAPDISAMVTRLAERMAQNPDDGKGWAMLGRSYRVMGQADKAHEAYKKAIALLPRDTGPRLEYAGMLLDEAQTLTPDFVMLMREVLAIDPAQPDALFFVGQAEAMIGNTGKARDLWNRLLTALPADAPERAEVVKQLESLK
jgi:cytochrome c-type biogenesis protein CcmH